VCDGVTVLLNARRPAVCRQGPGRVKGLELELETVRLKGLELEIEHIFPETPADTWSGDGQREWASFTEEERARHRALLQTLGNLALLEQPLNSGAGNKPFPKKKTVLPGQQGRLDEGAGG
jgi:uncharacterized protein DUF1524